MQKHYFPLPGKTVKVSHDLESWRNLEHPFETEIPLAPLPGSFGVNRKHHIHEGVDIYALHGDPVCFIRDGVIRAIDWFTGEKAGLHLAHWNNTMAVMVEDEDGVWNYGEINIQMDLRVGQNVRGGDTFARVQRVLRNDKGRPMDMLHIERYTLGTDRWIDKWSLGEEQPKNLVDPTQELLKLIA